eukprot:TRINITY_DN9302_c1_g1_i1.p2 TRINITY_DN9302_c1_g1~~TRINITY_DN9302_c1_g1_i1.p2  ORF type:complete len:118 (+),score=49.76 TRINITY_DN9302_c1_g1_i1:46-399(+)
MADAEPRAAGDKEEALVPPLPSLVEEWAAQVAELEKTGMLRSVVRRGVTDNCVSGELVMHEGATVAVDMVLGRGFIAKWDGKEQIFDSLHTLAVNVSPGAKDKFHTDLFAALSKLQQ